MKSTYLLLVVLILLGILWFLKTDSKDRKARKEATKVTAVITLLQCKQRLKSDKSLLKLKYKTKEYSVFFKNKNDCLKYKTNQKVTAYYSKTYDKIFLNL